MNRKTVFCASINGAMTKTFCGLVKHFLSINFRLAKKSITKGNFLCDSKLKEISNKRNRSIKIFAYSLDVFNDKLQLCGMTRKISSRLLWPNIMELFFYWIRAWMHNLCKRKEFNDFLHESTIFFQFLLLKSAVARWRYTRNIFKSCWLAKFKLCGIIGAETCGGIFKERHIKIHQF